MCKTSIQLDNAISRSGSARTEQIQFYAQVQEVKLKLMWF